MSHRISRIDRLREPVEKKFPKLAAWKRDHKARTILVLEDNDIQLTNQAIVTETVLPLALERLDRPDQIYVVASCMDRWRVWPVLIDGTSYFDFAQVGDAQDWAIDPAELSALTNPVGRVRPCWNELWQAEPPGSSRAELRPSCGNQ
jgi:hypothetical protein